MFDIEDLQIKNTNLNYSEVKEVVIFSQDEVKEMNQCLNSGAFILLGVASGIDSKGFTTHSFAVGCISGQCNPDY